MTDPELVEAVRDGIDYFLRNSLDSAGGDGSRPSAA